MIIDSHCHAWAYWPYEPKVPDPGRGSHANLLWEMANAGVARAVVICAAIGGNDDNAGDVIRAAAASDGRLVPFIDIDCRWHPTHRLPGGAARLDAAVRRLRPKGVTHYLREDEPADWLLSGDGLAFLSAIAERRLVLSLACGPRQMPTTAGAARRFPDLPILIHHLGRVRAGDDEALRLVVAAAAAPNVHVKFSGFGYGVETGWDFPLSSLRPIADALFAAFGPRRVLWGSDWPVSLRYMTYRQTLEIVRTHGPPMSKAERALVLGGNMARLLGEAA
jgi:predicted TIM-barrel fold metal-dependent hydrolase